MRNDFENIKAVLDASGVKYETWRICWNADDSPRNPPGDVIYIGNKSEPDRVFTEMDFDGNGKLLNAQAIDMAIDEECTHCNGTGLSNPDSV